MVYIGESLCYNISEHTNEMEADAMDSEKVYLAIDLKSFYASQECVERGLDPLTTNLVVADGTRTEKTICLAVSPALKSHGIPGRPRLFEVVEKVRQINALRREQAPGKTFTGSSWDAGKLSADPSLELDYIVAPPQMAHYVATSNKIYSIYLEYIAPQDIHVYSIDEVFIDATPYLKTYGVTPRELAQKLITAVLTQTGITATAGIGSNLYLCKVAMDIVAKRIPPDENGVRIAQLTELSYRQQLWNHRPLTDFWRVGPGYARKLERNGLYTMGDIARCSLGKPEEFYNEDLLYRLFGVNAQLLIDHAWGWESCTIEDIRSYCPSTNSISSGQVLQCPYPGDKARLILKEMADLLVLELVKKGLVTDQLVVTFGYDRESLTKGKPYQGAVDTDRYGRKVPKPAHGSIQLPRYTASTREIVKAALELSDRILDPALLVRKVNITANHVIPESHIPPEEPEQLDLFAPAEAEDAHREAWEKERKRQQAVLDIQEKYGKNAILKGMNYREGATTRQRNGQIGGHKA